MLLKGRPPRIDDAPADVRPGFEHLDRPALSVLRWLAANRVDFVLVGPVAEAIRGHGTAPGPVAIVPAPHRRNLERLARAVNREHGCIRVEGAGVEGQTDMTPTKLTGEKLARGQLWTLRCGHYDLDIEACVPGSTSYQELLYETSRFEPVGGMTIEVASPEDIEQYAHVRRTGLMPEMRVTRRIAVENGAG